jgi:glycerol-3-phosphate acyltransferase PlsY
MWADVLLVAGAYLFGSVPHLRFISRLRGLRLDGDYHQELWHRAGRVTGVIGVIGEFVKGATPVLVARALDFGPPVVAAAGVAAVCGQMWPVFAGFDGEKGNSIAIAMAAALAPLATLYALGFVIIALVIRMAPRLRSRASGKRIIGGEYSRSLPLGMFACFLALPLFARALGEPPAYIWGLAALFVLMIVVRRLTAGLRRDLRESSDPRSAILLRRLLYDRATVSWRQPA